MSRSFTDYTGLPLSSRKLKTGLGGDVLDVNLPVAAIPKAYFRDQEDNALCAFVEGYRLVPYVLSSTGLYPPPNGEKVARAEFDSVRINVCPAESTSARATFSPFGGG